MRKTDKIKRAIAFYFSASLFCVLLPIILSYALGYQIDYRNLKAYKTGILYINSHPAGASIYVNGRLRVDLTPAQIEKLKPGTYKVEVSREGFYPWENELVVRPNMVTKADRIVLFPITQEMKRIGAEGVSDFLISNRGYIYYMKGSGLFRSNMDGSAVKRLSSFSGWPAGMIGKKFSPDGDKFLCFNTSRVCIVCLSPDKTVAKSPESAKVDEVFSSPDPIIDAFWYPGSGYIIVVTEKDMKVVELGGGLTRNTVSLYKFNAKPQSLYYDENNDSLYFTDTRSGKDSHSIYRLDLKQKFFDQLIQLLIKKEPDTGYEKR